MLRTERKGLDLHRALAWAALALCAYFAVHGVNAGLRPGGSDFTIFYDGSRALLAGRDPGSVARFLYLPSFALALAPIAWLPYSAALVVWQLGSLAALAWIVRALPRSVTADGGVSPRWLAWVPLVVTLRLVDSNFANGQTNLYVLAAIVAALDAWLRERPVRAGAWLAFAAALKVVPALLACVWLVRGERRALASFALVLAFAVFVAPAPFLGFSGECAALAHWWHAQGAPYAGSASDVLAQHGPPPGQSLLATAYRLFHYARGETTDETTARVLVAVRVASSVVFVGWLAVLVRSVRRDAPLARVREFALTMSVALMLAPLVHKAHMSWMLVPVALLTLAPPAGLGRAARAVRLGLALVGAALVALTTPALGGRGFATHALDWNVVFFGLVAFAGALVLEAWCARREPLSAA
ncbi:MAG: DUF2029 domain-containing protein [Planctomycetes bacterium]|nr:DUF2029 domain-containing protein [Planctomycetota bacterium]